MDTLQTSAARQQTGEARKLNMKVNKFTIMQ